MRGAHGFRSPPETSQLLVVHSTQPGPQRFHINVTIAARKSDRGQPCHKILLLLGIWQRYGEPHYSKLRKNLTISTAANTNQKASNKSFLSGGKKDRN